MFFKKRKCQQVKNLALSNFRNSTITYPYIGKRGYIYNGSWPLTTLFEEKMVGFKIGDFSITKKFDTHCKKSVKRKGVQKRNNIIWVI